MKRKPPNAEGNNPVLDEPTYPVRHINANTLLLRKPALMLNENDTKGDWYQARKKLFARSQLLTIVFIAKDLLHMSVGMQIQKPDWDDALQTIRESGAIVLLDFYQIKEPYLSIYRGKTISSKVCTNLRCRRI